MSQVQPWSIIVNRSACSTREWKNWQFLLEKNKTTYTAYQTESLEQASGILKTLFESGNRLFLFAGGDGTIHQCGNLLLQIAGDQSNQVTIGVLPSGSGNDWVRTFGIEPKKLMASVNAGHTEPLNVIRITFPDGRVRYAFNMVGGALDAAVVKILLKTPLNISGSMKYPIALLKALTKPHTWKGIIRVDGKTLQGEWLTIQAGFGKYCGGGMYVLPHGMSDKAALLLMKPKSIIRLVSSLPKIYNGKIAKQREAIAMHFNEIEITHSEIPIPIEADGEWLGTSPVNLEVCYGILKRLAISD